MDLNDGLSYSGDTLLGRGVEGSEGSRLETRGFTARRGFAGKWRVISVMCTQPARSLLSAGSHGQGEGGEMELN